MGGNRRAEPETNRTRNAVAGALTAGALLLAPLGAALATPGVADAAPGGCSSSCTVGGADPSNPGNAQGGHESIALPGGGLTVSGSGVVPGGQQAGHESITTPGFSGSFSGNATDPTNIKGHCTGDLSGLC